MPSTTANSAVFGRPRLLGCEVAGTDHETGIRYIELEKFRLWEYVMQMEHGLPVQARRLGLWITYDEFNANSGPFLHGGEIEDVTCITISWFNPKRHYTLDVVRYVPTLHCESLKEILLSHVGEDGRNSRFLDVDEQAGVFVSQAIDEPELDLVLGLSDIHVKLDEGAA